MNTFKSHFRQRKLSHSALRLLLTLAIALSIAPPALPQFVAYNDHSPGTIDTQTHPNTTTYNIRGVAYTNSGYLKNIETGASLPVRMSWLVNGSLTTGNTGAQPNSSTPLYTNFYGFVYFGSSSDSAVQISAGSTITCLFTNLNPVKRYSFRGGAVRGGAYTDRWMKASLVGANSYVSAHSAGALTSTDAPADLLANEAAINTGDNRAGEIWDWEDIDPGSDGSFSVVCAQYKGFVPNGNASTGTYGYAINGFRLEEKIVEAGNGIYIVSPTNSQSYGACGSIPGSISVIGTYTNLSYFIDGTPFTNRTVGPWSPVIFPRLSEGWHFFHVLGRDANGTPFSSPTNSFRVGERIFLTAPTDGQVFLPCTAASASVTVSCSATNVTYFLDGLPFTNRTSAPWAPVALPNLPAGVHTIYATLEDTNVLMAYTVTNTFTSLPNPPPTIAITKTYVGENTNLIFPVGSCIRNNLSYSDSNGSITNIDWYANGQLRMRLPTGTTWSNSTCIENDAVAGTTAFQAVAWDGCGACSTSAPVTVTVTNPPDMTVILPNGSTWKYYNYTDYSNPNAGPPDDASGHAWLEPGYQDTAWPSGPGDFGVGRVYNQSPSYPPRTMLDRGATTVYLRHSFGYSDTNLLGNFILQIIRDSGAVVYLNGAELFRSGLPTGPLTYTNLSLQTYTFTSFFQTNFSPTLLQATNVLAVELHQDQVNSSDLRFDLMLWGDLTRVPPGITQQPTPIVAAVGDTVTFSVQVSGTPVFSYQWQRNGIDIPHATNQFLSLPSVQTNQSGDRYSVRVSNIAGSITSSNVLLSVYSVNFTRQPFLQNASSNSIQLFWRTTAAANTIVEYGPTEALGLSYMDPTLATNHLVTLSGLQPGTTYYYWVGSDIEGGGIRSAMQAFRTLKSQGGISFSVIGDSASYSGLPGAPQPMLANVLAMQDSDLVLHLGDVVAGGFTDTSADYQFFNIFQPATCKTPFFFSIGNHDMDTIDGRVDYQATNFFSAFSLPANSGDPRYYSFDHGDAHFVCLFNPWFEYYMFNIQSPQYAWLTNDLASSAKPWKIILLHASVSSSGPHAHDDYTTNGSGNGIPDMYEMMDLLMPVVTNFGVQMIFGSHDHAYERLAPTNGLHCIISGGGGRGLYPFFYPHLGSAQFYRLYHCLRVGLTNDTMTIQAIDTSGVVFDSMTVQKALPPSQTYNAVWNTPPIGTGVTNDADGNIPGQSFEFAGTPILARAGQFSNLGRTFVNNDSVNLYIALDQVMLYRNQNLFLFIESPRLSGVSAMAGLGNGLIDPQGQGVDGLDCLENLSFSGFTPSVGCVLGDEFADGQYRSFARTNLSLNIGQGIFYLNSALTDVPGTVLQQFNRSPQYTLYGSGNGSEQNADFIQVAVPFSSLGGLKPGDTIKIGAVAGGWDFDPVAQTRSIDSSVLGYALAGSGQASVALEGVTVRLAAQPSAPFITGTALPAGQYRLTWTAEPGTRYAIEYSTALPAFTLLNTPGLPLTATSETESFVVTPLPNQPAFYRVRVAP